MTANGKALQPSPCWKTSVPSSPAGTQAAGESWVSLACRCDGTARLCGTACATTARCRAAHTIPLACSRHPSPWCQAWAAALCQPLPHGAVLRVPVQRSRAVSRRGVVHPEVAQQTPLPRAAALQQQRGEGSSPAGSRQHLTQFLLPGCTSAQQPFATPTNCSSRTLIAHSKGSAGRRWSDMKSNLGSWM